MIINRDDIIDLNERHPLRPTPMQIQHPRARYAIWENGDGREEMKCFQAKVAAFRGMVTDYVTDHGNFVLFENKADAELWFVYR